MTDELKRQIKGKRLIPIADLKLDTFPSPQISGNRNLIWRISWYICSVFLFEHPLAILPNRAKASILRFFGAKIGKGLVLKPRVKIKYPWFLNLAQNVWLGELVWIDNHTTVTIGSNVCVSQGAYLFTGNHDWSDSAFSFFCKPIFIGDGVWITAGQFLGPGTEVPPNVAVVSRDRAEK